MECTNATSLKNGIAFEVGKKEKISRYVVVTEEDILEERIKKSKPHDIRKLITFTIIVLISNCNDMIKVYCAISFLWFLYNFIRFCIVSEKELLQYHAAEHKVINAYNYYQRIPTTEETKKASCLHSSCGTNITTGWLVFFALLYALCNFCYGSLDISQRVFLIIEAYCLYYLFIHARLISVLAEKVTILNFLQYFSTSKPTDYQLEIAIKGITMWERLVKLELPKDPET